MTVARNEDLRLSRCRKFVEESNDHIGTRRVEPAHDRKASAVGRRDRANIAVLFAIRARIEERALVEGLPDYADYAARVRYRLVPGLW